MFAKIEIKKIFFCYKSNYAIVHMFFNIYFPHFARLFVNINLKKRDIFSR